MFPTASYAFRALYGVWLIACRRTESVSYFDISVDGFWKSFLAALLVLPANVIITFVGLYAISETNYGIFAALRDLLIYGITWLLYPLLVLNFFAFLGSKDRALAYLIPYNWASVPLGYMFAVATVLNNFLSMVPFLGIFLLTTVYAVAICLFFEIARQGLKVSRLSAIGVVVFDFIFSISLMSILGSIKSQI